MGRLSPTTLRSLFPEGIIDKGSLVNFTFIIINSELTDSVTNCKVNFEKRRARSKESINRLI
jgi:hypothetical protein